MMRWLAPLAMLCAAVLMPAGAATPDEQAAAALAGRVLGRASAGFVFEQRPADGGRDSFELSSRGQRVVVRGNSALSMAVALNWYLKYHARASVSLNGRQVTLPSPLPPLAEPVRQTAWAADRYFLNYCTFGYSMPWWDWPQWERFIDFMALQGINEPLAVTGQEAVWQAVGRRFGLTDAEFDAFLAGPPYLPFQWMGCLDSHGGPLPKAWVARHADLARRILARERSLGMKPVLQGFTGHVPPALMAKFPDAKAQRIHWLGFSTLMLDPTDPLFAKIGAAFIEEQTRLFGTDHRYAADSFIEMTPPTGDLDYLANTGRAIYQAMAQSDPQAVWLLQGWTFMNQAAFWKPERIRAFLDAVPDDHMLVLDLFCESNPVWKATEAFFGKPWVWSFVYLFGDTTTLGSSGPLQRFADLADARRDPRGANLRGVGLMMEGFGHNPLLYDLMFESAWRDQIDLPAWLPDFAAYRYGRRNDEAAAAWEALRAGAYSRAAGGQRAVTAFPASSPAYVTAPAAGLTRAYRLLLSAHDALGDREAYRHDLVNVARQALSNHSGRLHRRVAEAFESKDAAAYRQASAAFLELITDLDDLLATNDEFLLGTWLADARRWGQTEAERARLEWNARRIITVWSPTGGGGLRDYAWKEWSGLLRGFYAQRWRIFCAAQQAALDQRKPFDEAACQAEVRRFEDAWCDQHERYPAAPRGDSYAVARRLFDKYLLAEPSLRSLTTDRPVTCSMALPDMDASLANDGVVDAESYWGTDVTKDPAAWWQVDLQQQTTVGRVVVVGYYGDERWYGFTVEGSADGQSWVTLADRRANRDRSTRAGYTCVFEARAVRYLRITMSSNSANTGRHLVEVSAYAK